VISPAVWSAASRFIATSIWVCATAREQSHTP